MQKRDENQCQDNNNIPLNQQVDTIVEKFHAGYNGNSANLRSAISPEDIWRFFTEERVQRYGTGIAQLTTYESFIKNHLNSTYAEIAKLGEIIEKKYKIAIANHSKKYYESFPDGNPRQDPDYKRLIQCKKLELEVWEQFIDQCEKLNLTTFLSSRSKYTLNELIQLDKGWVTFELQSNEPGYFKALYRAFDYIFKNHHSLTIDHLVELHRLASTGVQNYNHSAKPGIRFFDAGNVSHRFGLAKKNCTLNGLKQLLQDDKDYLNIIACLSNGEVRRLTCQKKNIETIVGAYENNSRIFIESTFKNDQEAASELQKLIDQYYLKISKIVNNTDKLRTIIEFILDCTQMHPFKDGNCRTFVMLTLNELLLENKFPITLLRDANCFGCYSTDELLKEVIDGMKNVFELIRYKSLFDVKTDHIIQDLKVLAEKYNEEYPDAQHALNLHIELTQLEQSFRQSSSNSLNFN